MLRVLKGSSVSIYTLVYHISRAKVFFYRKNIHAFTEVVGQEHNSKLGGPSLALSTAVPAGELSPRETCCNISIIERVTNI